MTTATIDRPPTAVRDQAAPRSPALLETIFRLLWPILREYGLPVGGLAVVVWGVWTINQAAGIIAAGVSMLVLDLQIKYG